MGAEDAMNLERFEQIVDAYGAEPRAWPEAERDAALAFCNADPRACTLRDEAQALDALLAKSENPAPDRALENRIMADYKGKMAGPSRRWLGAGALAASLILGVTAAWVILRPHSGVDLSDPAAWEVLGDDLEFGAQQRR